MSILQASNNIARLYHGFDTPAPAKAKVVTACVDQEFIDKELEATVPALILSLRELQIWNDYGRARKLHWLMGRLAAKAAVSELLSNMQKTSPPQNEIEILNAENGSPYCNMPAPLPVISISIAHTDGLAAACASQVAGIGIDVERADRYKNEEFPQMSFTDDDRAQIEQCAGLINSITLTRIWTAKEAAGKAVQLGLGQILSRCRFAGCSPDLSTITLCSGSTQVNVKSVQEKNFFLSLAIL